MNARELLLRVGTAERRTLLAEEERGAAEAAANHLWIRIEELQARIKELEARLGKQAAA